MLRRKVVELWGMAAHALHGAALLVQPRLHPAVMASCRHASYQALTLFGSLPTPQTCSGPQTRAPPM